MKKIFTIIILSTLMTFNVFAYDYDAWRNAVKNSNMSDEDKEKYYKEIDRQEDNGSSSEYQDALSQAKNDEARIKDDTQEMKTKIDDYMKENVRQLYNPESALKRPQTNINFVKDTSKIAHDHIKDTTKSHVDNAVKKFKNPF